MKKIFILFLLLLLPYKIKALDIGATSAILMDTDNNRIIYSKNIHNQRSVASISKIMTAVLAIESGKLEEEVIIDETIKQAYGSAVYLSIGEKLKLIDLVYALMLRSGNDAALAIANFVGTNIDNFVENMNNKAKEIGMKNTIFNNPHGLEEEGGNISTAYDMAILTSYAMRLEEYKKIVSTMTYNLKTNKNTYLWLNKNKLLKLYSYTTGGKTGFTDIAKRTLVTTASKDGINLVAVTLNDGNDFNDHKKMFEYGFNNFINYEILKPGNITIYDEKYYKDYNIYIKDSFSYIVANSEKDNLKQKFLLEKNKKINNDNKIGIMEIYLNDEKIHEVNIYGELKIIHKKSTWDKIKEWLGNLW